MTKTTNPSEIAEQGRLWAIRVGDPSFGDWDGFTAWLEQDPAHQAAYDAALDAEAWAAETLTLGAHEVAASAADLPPRRTPRRRWLGFGGAMAAALAGVAGWAVLDRGPGLDTIETAPGEHRAIALADGSRIVLNGGTRIAYDPQKPRHVELAHGEALFDVRHDARYPFVVIASGTRLLDAGTVFNVIGDGGSLDVAVAHGAVIYEPGKQAIRLEPGDALSRAGEDGAPVLRKAAVQSVGSWQSGVLQYDDAPLTQVAGDLGRNLGRAVEPAGGAERLRFTGTLAVSGPPDQVLARAGALLGVKFEVDGDAWKMTPADGARR